MILRYSLLQLTTQFPVHTAINSAHIVIQIPRLALRETYLTPPPFQERPEERPDLGF